MKTFLIHQYLFFLYSSTIGNFRPNNCQFFLMTLFSANIYVLHYLPLNSKLLEDQTSCLLPALSMRLHYLQYSSIKIIVLKIQHLPSWFVASIWYTYLHLDDLQLMKTKRRNLVRQNQYMTESNSLRFIDFGYRTWTGPIFFFRLFYLTRWHLHNLPLPLKPQKHASVKFKQTEHPFFFFFALFTLANFC